MTFSVTPLGPQPGQTEGPLAAPRGSTPDAQRRAAEDFEAQMLGALLQPMFNTVPANDTFGGGSAEAQWRPMLVEQFGHAMAHAGGVGIGSAVLAEMQRIQAQATQPGSQSPETSP